jgi:hypothetical protein
MTEQAKRARLVASFKALAAADKELVLKVAEAVHPKANSNRESADFPQEDNEIVKNFVPRYVSKEDMEGLT